jgi:Uri superfamily endonuclease
MQSRSGTYALVLKSSSDPKVEVGKLGRLHVRPGFYVYVGSAFGPGGLKARIAHHMKISARPHWLAR